MGSVSNERVAKNTLILYFRMLLTLGVALYTSRIVLEVLGASDYGLYNVVGGVVTMLAFLNSSIGSGTSRFLAFELGRENKERLSVVFNVALVSHIIIALLILFIAESIGLWFVNTQLVFPSERSFAVNVVYQVSILTAMLQFTQVPYNADIIAHEEMGVYAYVAIAEVFLKLVMVIILKYVTTSDALIAYSLMLFAVQVIILSSYRIYCMQHYSESKWKFVRDVAVYKEIFTFSGWDVVGGLTVVTQGHGINILLNIYFGPVINAARAISYQVQGAFLQFTNNFMTAVTPELVKSYARKEYKATIRLVNDSALYSYYLLMLLVIPVMFRLPQLLGLWLGDYPEHTVVFTQIILALMMLRSLARPVINAIHATGDIKNLNLYAGILGLFPLPVAWLALHLGAPAVTTFWILFLWGIFANIAENIILKTKMRGVFSIREHLLYVYVRSFFVTCLFLLPIYFLNLLFCNNLLGFCIYYAFSLCIGVLIVFYIGMPVAMRKKIIEKFKMKYALRTVK